MIKTIFFIFLIAMNLRTFISIFDSIQFSFDSKLLNFSFLIFTKENFYFHFNFDTRKC